MHWFGSQQMMVLPWLQWGVLPAMLWSLTWKGLALWHASKRDEKWWFIALLVINTLGILEMCYLLFVVRLFAGKAPTKTATKKKRT
jgi:methionyl-tRNA synthetase